MKIVAIIALALFFTVLGYGRSSAAEVCGFVTDDTTALQNDSVIFRKIRDDLGHTMFLITSDEAGTWNTDSATAHGVTYLFLCPGTPDASVDGGNGLTSADLTYIDTAIKIPQVSYSNIAAEVWGLSNGAPVYFGSGVPMLQFATTTVASFVTAREQDSIVGRLNNGFSATGYYALETDTLGLKPVLIRDSMTSSSVVESGIFPTLDSAVVVYVDSGGQTHTHNAVNFRGWWGYYGLQNFNNGYFPNMGAFYDGFFWRLNHRMIALATGDTLNTWFNHHVHQGYDMPQMWWEGGTSGEGAVISDWMQINTSKTAIDWQGQLQPYGFVNLDTTNSTIHSGWINFEGDAIYPKNYPSGVVYDSGQLILHNREPNLSSCLGASTQGTDPHAGAYDFDVGLFWIDTNVVLNQLDWLSFISVPTDTALKNTMNYPDEFYLQYNEIPASPTRHWLPYIRPNDGTSLDTIVLNHATNSFGRVDVLSIDSTVMRNLVDGTAASLLLMTNYVRSGSADSCAEYRWTIHSTGVSPEDSSQTRFISWFHAPATSSKAGTIKLGTAQQGIDGTCDFGYGASTTDAVDTMAKYFDRIGPYAECGSPSNPLYTADSTLDLLVYLSLLDMPASYDTTWATSGTYAGIAKSRGRRAGWIKHYLDSAQSWTVDQREKLYLHFYDTTTFSSSGVTDTIPGCFCDSSTITAADSVSRVPNGYANSSAYWTGNTYTTPTRLLPNLTNEFVRDGLQEYVGIACSTLTGGSLNFWPGKTTSFQGVFFDNSSDIGLGLAVLTGGHIVESYDVSIGAIASNIDSMVIPSVTGGSFIPANRTAFDIWWWDNNVKPFLMGLDTFLDTLVTPYGKDARYMLNCGFMDPADHFYDTALGPHENLLEWGGFGGRGHSNADYNGAGVFDRSIDSQYVRDSLAVVRGNTRQVWVRTVIGTYTGAQTSSAGGGTQDWHDGWINTYILFLLLNGDSTYYDMWDRHTAYVGSADPTAAASEFDSLHFGSQGTFDFRATMNRSLGSKTTSQPSIFATGTADGDAYEVWSTQYAGDATYPNGWRVLFRERSCDVCEFMSNSTPVAVPLDTSYQIYGSDHTKSGAASDTMLSWADSLTTATYDTVYLRAGEGVILYPTAAVAGPPPTAAFSGTPLSGTVTFSVTFTDASTNSPTSWAWTFGDGGSSTLQNPSHNYTTAGTYDVQLIATNANGADTLQKVGYITANNPAPTSSGNRVKVLQ